MTPDDVMHDDFLAQTMKARAAQQNARANSIPTMEQQQAWREHRERLRAALGKAPQIAALQEVLANERPSYFPGMDFAQTAYHEGRKAALRDLLAFLTTPENT